MVADKFQWVFSESLLNAGGKEVKFCRRQRVITPFRLGLALTATCASQPVETIADFHCGFNALFGTTITYKAFYNQVAKPHFADFARTMTERLISEMTLKVLGFEKGRALSEFRHIVIQDGSSFAIHDGLRAVFARRFTKMANGCARSVISRCRPSTPNSPNASESNSWCSGTWTGAPCVCVSSSAGIDAPRVSALS